MKWRSGCWGKLKHDRVDGLGDTITAALVAARWGANDRSGRLGAYGFGAVLNPTEVRVSGAAPRFVFLFWSECGLDSLETKLLGAAEELGEPIDGPSRPLSTELVELLALEVGSNVEVVPPDLGRRAAPSDEAGGLAAELRDAEEEGRQLAERQRQTAERARQLRERMADKAKLERQANELERLRDENQNLRNLQQIVAEELGRVTPDAAAPSTGDVAPEGYAIVAVLLANEGLSGLLELFVENEIDDDALVHVSVEDLVEVGAPAAAARRILSK